MISVILPPILHPRSLPILNLPRRKLFPIAQQRNLYINLSGSPTWTINRLPSLHRYIQLNLNLTILPLILLLHTQTTTQYTRSLFRWLQFHLSIYQLINYLKPLKPPTSPHQPTKHYLWRYPFIFRLLHTIPLFPLLQETSNLCVEWSLIIL